MLVGYVRLSPASRNGTSSKIGKVELSENGGGLKPLRDLSDALKRRISFPICLLMRTRKAFRQFRPASGAARAPDSVRWRRREWRRLSVSPVHAT